MGDVLYLVPQSLLSKWGFWDGDMPEQVWDRIDAEELGYENVDWHTVLRSLVRRYLLPELARHHQVEVYDIETNHNPIRASIVDGTLVNDFEGTPDVAWCVPGVAVPMDEVMREIRTAIKRNEAGG